MSDNTQNLADKMGVSVAELAVLARGQVAASIIASVAKHMALEWQKLRVRVNREQRPVAL